VVWEHIFRIREMLKLTEVDRLEKYVLTYFSPPPPQFVAVTSNGTSNREWHYNSIVCSIS